jgi:hypothetical protein
LSFLYNDCVRIGRRGNTNADSDGNRDTDVDADSYSYSNANFNSAAHSNAQTRPGPEGSPDSASSPVRRGV